MARQRLPLYYGGPLRATTGTFSGAVDLADDIELSEVTPASFSTNQNNFATGTATVQRLNNTDTVSSRTITGFAGGRVGRLLIVLNIGTGTDNSILLGHQNASSSVANRIICPNAADLTLALGEAAVLWYDNTTLRWRVVGTAV